jgi:hypothetical protein
MKALLVWHGRTFRKTHSLIEVVEPCVSIDPSLDQVVRNALDLSSFAWQFRYPRDDHDPTPIEPESALSRADDVVRAVLSRLPEDVRPIARGT